MKRVFLTLIISGFVLSVFAQATNQQDTVYSEENVRLERVPFLQRFSYRTYIEAGEVIGRLSVQSFFDYNLAYVKRKLCTFALGLDVLFSLQRKK